MDGAIDPPAAEADTAGELARLSRENAKLRKINKVLIDRVERSMDFQGNAYSLFQTATLLETQVRERTQELEAALRELAKSNRALILAKEEAETARMRLAAAIDSISEGFILCDAEDRLVLCNSKYRELWPGLAEIIHPGVPFLALVHHANALGLFDDDDAVMETAMKRRLHQHRLPQEMFVLRLADGRWLQISERRTADGGSVAIYTDITTIKLSEQRQRERELAEKSALLQAIFDNIAQGISMVDADWRVVAWNGRFLELVSIAPDEMAVGKPLRDLMHLPAIRCQLLHAGFGRADLVAPMRMEQMADNGRVLEIQIGPMPGGGMVCTYSDITERKASEWALRDSEQRIRLITDALPALIAYVDAGQRYRFTNKPYEDWFDRPRSEINGRHMRAVLGARLYETRRPHVEMVLSGRHTTFEIDLRLAGGRIEFALATYVPHFGPDGEVLGFVALIQDISERRKAAEQLREAKETLERRVAERTIALTSLNGQLQQEIEERRQAEAALREAKAEAEQANMSKTKFIAAASHDLLQPLNAARVFSAALGDSRMSGRNRHLVANIGAALNAVDDLLSALLDISKLDAGAPLPEIADFRIGALLTTLSDELAPQAKVRALALRVVPCGLTVRSDPLLVGRILRNFLSNALRYTPAGRILLGCRRRPEGVEVLVADSGIGIPADKRQEIFDEFRRLAADSHGPDRGMGLGLAIVQRIARHLGHPLILRSTLGRGSAFGLLLPYGDPRAVLSPEAVAALPPGIDRVAGLFIALVENDLPAQEAMRELLCGWKCAVTTAAAAEMAVSRLRGLGRRPDVLVADYHLDHDRTGLEALATIQALWPDTPIPGVIITADRSDAMQAAVRAAGYHLLNKPLKPARLRSLLAHLAPAGK